MTNQLKVTIRDQDEAVWEPRIKEQTADFRTYEPEWGDSTVFGWVQFQLCETLNPESGRWEGFTTIVSRTNR